MTFTSIEDLANHVIDLFGIRHATEYTNIADYIRASLLKELDHYAFISYCESFVDRHSIESFENMLIDECIAKLRAYRKVYLEHRIHEEMKNLLKGKDRSKSPDMRKRQEKERERSRSPRPKQDSNRRKIVVVKPTKVVVPIRRTIPRNWKRITTSQNWYFFRGDPSVCVPPEQDMFLQKADKDGKPYGWDEIMSNLYQIKCLKTIWLHKYDPKTGEWQHFIKKENEPTRELTNEQLAASIRFRHFIV
jgi:hypothetical protein